MINLIITDMDGTLLTSDGKIPDEFWNIHEKMKEKKIIFSVASGRPYYNLKEKFSKIKDDILFIAENGACVMYKDEEIYSAPMLNSDVEKILTISKEIDRIALVLCGKNTAYVEKKVFENKKYDFKSEIEKYYNRIEFVEKLEDVKDEIIKIAICDFLVSENNSYQYYKKLEDDYMVVISGKVWLDLMKLGTNKGVAVKIASQKLNISLENIMVFGDYLNDYEMMKVAKYSYAIKNAHPKLKEIANYITTEDNNNNGVVNTIKKYL